MWRAPLHQEPLLHSQAGRVRRLALGLALPARGDAIFDRLEIVDDDIRPSEQIRAERNTEGPVYFAMHTEVLRFVVGRWLGSVMGLQLGTAIPPGSALRMQFDFLTLGVKL